MKQKLLFLLTALCFGVISGVKADVTVPTPVYFQDFESASVITDVGTVTGSGELATGSSIFGKYYQNDPACAGGNRTNYLTITTDAFSTLKATNTGETTISFWVNSYKIIQNSFGIYWNEMFAAWTDGGYSSTVSASQYNDNGGDIGAFDLRTNLSTHAMLNGSWYDGDGNHSTLDVTWLTTSKGSAFDNNWHHVAYIMSNNMSHITVYIDGETRNDYDIANIGHIADFSGTTFWENLSNLTKITLGGLSHRWVDPDSPLGYDEVAIYSSALSANQVNQIIQDKIGTRYDYSIKAVSGGTIIKDFISGKDADGTEFSTYLPKVIYYGGNYYELDDDDVTGYYAQYEIDGADANKEINYTLNSNIKAFFECENMANSHAWFNTLANSEIASNGSAVTIYGGNDAHITNSIGAGIYNISVSSCSTWGDNYNDSFKLQYSTDNTNWVDIKTLNYAKNVGSVQTAENVSMPGGYLRLLDVSGHTPRHYVDYILVEKVGDYPNEIVGSISCTDGWATVWNTTPVVVSAGETGYYKFVNHNSGGTNTYENWYLWAAKYGTTDNFMALRADKAANIGGENGSFNEDFSIDNLASDLNGATVELFTSLIDAGDGTYTLKVTAVTTKKDGTVRTPNYVYTQTNIGTNKANLYVSVEKCWLEILEQKTYPTNVSKTITSAKWATFCSPYALDFSSSIENLDAAYIVTGGENKVLALTEVTGTVPANTGLLLKGEGECAIPVAASSSTNVSANKLVGVTSSTQLAVEDGYVLMASPKVGFYKNANIFTLGANTAYLPIDFDNNSGARSAFFGFDENPTAINAIVVADAENSVKDGKFLENGKIVIVKNGVKYSTNGQKLN